MDLAPKFLAAGAIVIDLSGAFRLRTARALQTVVQGRRTPRPRCSPTPPMVCPNFAATASAARRLISNPGCYPTAANLAIRPLIEAGIVDRNAGIVCDAKSGVSGAGRKPTLKTSFCEATENFSAYSILKHRHVPEVLLTSGLEEREFSFTAQLLPIDRGILETIYFRMAQPLSGAEIIAIYEKQLRQRALHPALRSRQRARSARRRAHELLRYRRDRGPRHAAAAWWSARSTIWAKARPARPSRTSIWRSDSKKRRALLVKALIKIGGSLLDDPASRNEHRRADRGGRSIGSLGHRRAWRRQADDAVSRRTRHPKHASCAVCESRPKKPSMRF